MQLTAGRLPSLLLGYDYSGVDADVAVGNAWGVADGDSLAVRAIVGEAVAAVCGDDIRDALDALKRKRLEQGISANRATSIGTTKAATTARFVQLNIFFSRTVVSTCRSAFV